MTTSSRSTTGKTTNCQSQHPNQKLVEGKGRRFQPGQVEMRRSVDRSLTAAQVSNYNLEFANAN